MFRDFYARLRYTKNDRLDLPINSQKFVLIKFWLSKLSFLIGPFSISVGVGERAEVMKNSK